MPKILGMPTVITGIITALLIWIIRPDKYCDVYKYKCHRGSDESSSLTGDHSNNGKFRTWHVVLPFGINSDIILHNYGICVSFNLGALEEQTDCHGKIGNGRNSNNSKKCSEMVSPEQRARMCATDDSYNWIQQLLFNLLLVFSASVVALKLTNKICSVLHSENTCALQICRRRRSKKHKEKLSNSTRHNKNNNNTNSTYVKRHTCSFKK